MVVLREVFSSEFAEGRIIVTELLAYFLINFGNESLFVGVTLGAPIYLGPNGAIGIG